MNSIDLALAFLLIALPLVMFAASQRSVSRANTLHAPGAGSHHVIVPLLESVASMQAVERACQLAFERKSDIVLASVILVPYTIGLDVPLPGAEDCTRRLLSKGARIANQRGLPVEGRSLRDHSAEQAMLDLSREMRAEEIVVGMGTGSSWLSSQIGKTVSGLFQHAPCRVAVDKVKFPTWN